MRLRTVDLLAIAMARSLSFSEESFFNGSQATASVQATIFCKSYVRNYRFRRIQMVPVPGRYSVRWLSLPLLS